MRRPRRKSRDEIEVRADGQREDGALDDDDAERAPERQRPRAERARRQRADVERADVAHIAPPAAGASFGRGSVRCANGQSCVPPSSGLFGQNQPTIVTNTGTAP